METQKFSRRNAVVYGNPINHMEYDVLKPNGTINKKNLILLAEAWLNEISNGYRFANRLEGREPHPYKIHRKYFDATGINHNLSNLNIVTNYISEVKKMIELNQKTGINDLYELATILDISDDVVDKISICYNTYNNCLVRRK